MVADRCIVRSRACPRLLLLRHLLLANWLLPLARAVLRYPDAGFESRFPLHVDECGTPPFSSEATPCLQQLRAHLLEDGDCNRVICDNINTSTPVEVYANETDWVPFKNFCGHLQEFFLKVFDLGVKRLEHPSDTEDRASLAEDVSVFADSSQSWIHNPDVEGEPDYSNSSRSVLRRHFAEALSLVQVLPLAPEALLTTAADLARRLQMLIENFSVTLLLNFHIARLEHNGRMEGKNMVHSMYGDVSEVSVRFHEIPGKRWDALSFLLDRLHVSERPVAMAEIGVEAANTSQRLLEKNPLLSYVGVDPYIKNDALYEDVLRRLSSFRSEGRFQLHRDGSLPASGLVPDHSLDLVFLDARHDYEAVWSDMAAWHRKVRRGGILSGHDFSWMFPTVAMAVYKASFGTPERTIHLAPDGVWWFQL